ncbi:hypothetical protein, variant 3 [Aphanomyces invadans]|uniref:Uncharacterized protein n=1 Tax=Aphanomyces invadans TaxID=157072 RepID=A0A024T9X8_9STRA|nr:hypothetical protein, variant 2 [Aphanomyces invadans]XP_008880571.1 hypothetical protein, variant 3 [Aphanomyces invadans]ETV90813.1 hypothetical protein, variant 2 [Aphanomyces invadans]ETV90814.1 hypothetical protein, variant 3 [Aphanomyces invadans]|eukprot:XP_008880570.1 hypothetical protein, variant 2 [Aphanomyces invadans]
MSTSASRCNLPCLKRNADECGEPCHVNSPSSFTSDSSSTRSKRSTARPRPLPKRPRRLRFRMQFVAPGAKYPRVRIQRFQRLHPHRSCRLHTAAQCFCRHTRQLAADKCDGPAATYHVCMDAIRCQRAHRFQLGAPHYRVQLGRPARAVHIHPNVLYWSSHIAERTGLCGLAGAARTCTAVSLSAVQPSRHRRWNGRCRMQWTLGDASVAPSQHRHDVLGVGHEWRSQERTFEGCAIFARKPRRRVHCVCHAQCCGTKAHGDCRVLAVESIGRVHVVHVSACRSIGVPTSLTPCTHAIP